MFWNGQSVNDYSTGLSSKFQCCAQRYSERIVWSSDYAMLEIPAPEENDETCYLVQKVL